jgi:hypothetical protein
MKNIVAIDVALLPPPGIWDWAVDLSKEINRGIEQKIILDKTHLPHVTLLQMYVNCNDLKKIFDSVTTILQDFQSLNLNAQEIVVTTPGTEERWISIKIEKAKDLERLHKEILDNLKKYRQKKDSNAFLTDKNEVASPFSLQLQWVEDSPKSDYAKYFPHITLAISDKVPPQIQPREFVANRLAICHLGNYCTCRKILREWELL